MQTLDMNTIALGLICILVIFGVISLIRAKFFRVYVIVLLAIPILSIAGVWNDPDLARQALKLSTFGAVAAATSFVASKLLRRPSKWAFALSAVTAFSAVVNFFLSRTVR